VFSNGNGCSALDIDPATFGGTLRIVACFQAGTMTESSTNGDSGTWSTPLIPSQDYSTDVVWLGQTTHSYLTVGELRFDPSRSNTVVISCGIGVLEGNPNTTAFTLTSKTRGIDNLTFNRIVAPPNTTEKPILAVWDRLLIKSDNQDAFPTVSQPSGGNFGHCWHWDYSVDGNTFACTTFRGAPQVVDYSGISTDQGVTWIPFPTSPHMASATLTATTTASQILTIGGGVPAIVQIGWSEDSSQATVLSKTATTVTLSYATTISSGTVVTFDAPSGACVAASTSTNFMICPAGFPYSPQYTTDGGTTWNYCNISDTPVHMTCTTTAGSNVVTNPSLGTTRVAVNDLVNLIQNGGGYRSVTAINAGVSFTVDGAALANVTTETASFDTGWPHASYDNFKCIAADRVTANKFYAMNYARGFCYRSTDGGATWTKGTTNLNSGSIKVRWFQAGTLRAVDGNAGHVVWGNDTCPLMLSTDSGDHWAAVPNVTAARCFGFGKAKPGGGGHPAVFLCGTVSGVASLFRSDDFEQATPTWTDLSVGRNPLNILCTYASIDGDKNVYGRFYGLYGVAPPFYGSLDSSGNTIILHRMKIHLH
jgi:hypothetical protein